jgi:hypothetical protein
VPPRDAEPPPCDDIVMLTVADGIWMGQRDRRCYHGKPYEAWVRTELAALQRAAPASCSLSIEVATLEKEPFDQVIRVLEIVKELHFERFNVVHPDSATIPAAQLAKGSANASCASAP